MPHPEQTAGEVYALCISGKITAERKARLETLQGIMEVADDAYHAAAQKAELFTIPEDDFPDGVNSDEILSVYHQRVVGKDSLGRHIYDAMILAPANNRICPLCGIGTVYSLDHYLPERFWKFIVTPRNLVPACLTCNKAKLEHFPDSFETQTIHPYYDDFQSHTWLCASIVEVSPPGVTYEVANVENWDPRNIIRAKTHFDELDLGILFTSNAGNELSERKEQFRDLFAANGPDSVRNHLLSELSYCRRKNHWKTALYRALSESDWFCNEGCLQI